jgi:hypothetical protein
MRKSSVNEVRPGSLEVSVHDSVSSAPLVNATICVYSTGKQNCDNLTLAQLEADPAGEPMVGVTDMDGVALFPALAPGGYFVVYDHFPRTERDVVVQSGCNALLRLPLELGASVALSFETPDGQPRNSHSVRQYDRALAKVGFNHDNDKSLSHVQVRAAPPWARVAGERFMFSRTVSQVGDQRFEAEIAYGKVSATTSLAVPGNAMVKVEPPVPATSARLPITAIYSATGIAPIPITGNIGVSMTRTETEATKDLALWTLIRNSTDAMSFTSYLHFMDALFCTRTNTGKLSGFDLERQKTKEGMFSELRKRRALPFTDSDAYRVLKVATEAFVMVNCGVLSAAFNDVEDQAYLDRRDIPGGVNLELEFQKYLEPIDNTKVLPYLAIIRRKLPDVAITLPHETPGEADLCYGIVQQKLDNPCLLELIWSYWHEEGMLVQTMNTITQRFQNVRSLSANDPLANLEIDPLRPLNNLIWGYTQDEQHRLTVVRRNYEYDHHYGVRLDGKAVQHFRPADTRSKFLEAFHYLLRLCTVFYRQDDDTTVKADAFPILNALKEVHLILSQGAHNQFGDLPSTARIEMLMQQWMLARPEFREFLPTRVMVAYPEPWMDRVDAMKKLQGWSDTSVLHFRNLAMFGEQILLSVRYGNWSDIFEPTEAFNWARFWRPQIQGYVHAYRAATGVDLTIDARDPQAEGTLPSILLRQRLAQQVRA